MVQKKYFYVDDTFAIFLREKGKTKHEQNMNKTRQPSMYKTVVGKRSVILFYLN